MKNKRAGRKYNGKNIFGERCVAKSIKLHKETAVKQYLDILADVTAHKDQNTEYTVDASELTAAELMAVEEAVNTLLHGRGYCWKSAA